VAAKGSVIMRAREFIKESTSGKLDSAKQNTSRGIHKFTDGERWNSDYKAYRLGLTVASCDGVNVPDVDFESWVGRWKTAHPYTQVEADMLRLSYMAAEIEFEDLNHGDLKSQEPDDTNTQSPVANWMKK
jgi:hypothetical protein